MTKRQIWVKHGKVTLDDKGFILGTDIKPQPWAKTSIEDGVTQADNWVKGETEIIANDADLEELRGRIDHHLALSRESKHYPDPLRGSKGPDNGKTYAREDAFGIGVYKPWNIGSDLIARAQTRSGGGSATKDNRFKAMSWSMMSGDRGAGDLADSLVAAPDQKARDQLLDDALNVHATRIAQFTTQ